MLREKANISLVVFILVNKMHLPGIVNMHQMADDIFVQSQMCNLLEIDRFQKTAFAVKVVEAKLANQWKAALLLILFPFFIVFVIVGMDKIGGQFFELGQCRQANVVASTFAIGPQCETFQIGATDQRFHQPGPDQSPLNVRIECLVFVAILDDDFQRLQIGPGVLEHENELFDDATQLRAVHLQVADAGELAKDQPKRPWIGERVHRYLVDVGGR